MILKNEIRVTKVLEPATVGITGIHVAVNTETINTIYTQAVND